MMTQLRDCRKDGREPPTKFAHLSALVNSMSLDNPNNEIVAEAETTGDATVDAATVNATVDEATGDVDAIVEVTVPAPPISTCDVDSSTDLDVRLDRMYKDVCGRIR